MDSQNLLIWNVHGLNTSDHQKLVRELVIAKNPSIVCLQETKLHVLNDFLVMEILGPGFNYSYLSAENTRGGILVAWRGSVWSASSVSSRVFSISIRMQHISLSIGWWLTVVYGPSKDWAKAAYLTELDELHHLRSGPWLLTGDFNLIYQAKDKNNDRLDWPLMGQFKSFLNYASLKEIHLGGRLFTWSNERTHPTLERIDRAFISRKWDELYPHHDL
jgi:exonuclease III